MPQDYKQGLWTGRGKGHAGDVEGGVGEATEKGPHNLRV